MKNQLDRDLLVIDVETTGTESNASVIQIGAVIVSRSFDIEPVNLSLYVKPYTDVWEEKASQVHGIKKEFLLEKGMSIEEALEQLEKFVNYKFRDYYIAQWSSSFDTDMLKNAYKHIGVKYPYSWRVFDISSFTRLYLAGLGLLPKKRVSLKDCAEALGISFEKDSLHNAEYDAFLASQCLVKIQKNLHCLKKLFCQLRLNTIGDKICVVE